MAKLIRICVYMCLVILVASCHSGNCPDSISDNVVGSVHLNTSDGGIANGQINVPNKPNIILLFDIAIDISSVNHATVNLSTTPDLTDSSVVRTTNFISNNDGTSFYFTSLNNLAENTKYYIIVRGVRAAKGGLIAPAVFEFTTGDYIAPTVAALNPSNNATNVSSSPVLQIVFSESVLNVSTSTVSLHVGSVDGAVVATSGLVLGADNTYTFTALSNLVGSTKYCITASNEITDLMGNRLLPNSFCFTTGDLTSPTVQKISPLSSVMSGSIVTFKLQFSESVLNVNTTNVELHEVIDRFTPCEVGPIVPIIFQGELSNNVYTFSTVNNYTSGAALCIAVKNSITDLSGNSLIAPYIFGISIMRD